MKIWAPSNISSKLRHKHCGSRKIKYYVSEFKSHYYCGALASHMTSPNSSPNIFGGNWVSPSQFGQLEHWLSTKKKVLKKLRREMKYHIFKSNTQILIIFPQFLMVLTLNMHKNVKRNGKNGLQYFLFFKKTKYMSSNYIFFINIMPQKLQNGADLQNLP